MFMFFSMVALISCSVGASVLLGRVVTDSLSHTSVLVNLSVWSWGKTEVTLTCYFDLISVVFATAVLLISFSVMLFSGYYLNSSPSANQFHLTLLVFIFSMLLLIFSPSLVSLMLGWDGLGVSSYLLVIFYKSAKSLNAGLLTGISNRVGDGLILISLGGFMTFPFCHFVSLGSSGANVSELVLGMLVLAACTKSAQIPFSAWLPAAMAAPTPVSALVHSSTLVTAGIYLMIRLSNWFYVSYGGWAAFLGSLTMVLASLSALKENDAKKIVALSTLSQLGVMMTGFSFNMTSLIFFHLLAHAFFKALLFVSTGFIIHNHSNYQNLRLMGGNFKWMTMNSSIMLSTKASLSGLPFFAAFYSKESLLESLSSSVNGLLVVYVFMVLGVVMTVLYSARFIFLTSYGTMRGPNGGALSINSSILIYSAIVLYIISNVSGKFLFLSLASFKSVPTLSLSSKLVTLIVLFSAAFLYFIKYNALKSPFKFYSFMWGLPLIAASTLIKPMKSLGVKVSKSLSFSSLDYLLFGNSVVLGYFNNALTTQSVLAPQKVIMGVALMGLSVFMLGAM